MPTDIKLSQTESHYKDSNSRDILLGIDDFLLIHDDECIKQDIFTFLHSSTNSLFYDPKYGSSFLKLIHSSLDQNTLLQFKQEVKITLLSDPRIESNSIEITTSYEDYLTIEITCISKLTQAPINLSYSLNQSF